MADWSVTAKAMRDLVRTLRDLPLNVVLIAHESFMEDGEALVVQPEIGGKTTAEVMAEVDIVGYTGIVEDEGERIFMARLVDGNGRRAKDRSGALGTHRQLDLSEWLDTFKEALKTDLSDIPWEASDED